MRRVENFHMIEHMFENVIRGEPARASRSDIQSRIPDKSKVTA